MSFTLDPVPLAPEDGGDITQAEWAFDSIKGKNTNLGDRSAPLKDWDGYLARIDGSFQRVNQDVHYYILNDIDKIDFSGHVLGVDGSITLHGVPTVVRSGVLSNVIQRNPVLNQSDEYEDGILDWTSDVGKHLIEVDIGDIINGPVRCWVLKELTGPNRARITLQGQRSVIDPFNLYYVSAVPGNTYKVLRLPKVLAFETGSGLIDDLGNSYEVQAEFLDFSSISNTIINGDYKFQDCLFNVIVIYNTTQLFNCLSVFLSPGFGTTVSYFGGVLNGQLFLNGGGIHIAYGLMLQHSKLVNTDNIGTLLNHVPGFGLGVYDSDIPIDLESGGRLLNESSIYGTGNTTAIMRFVQGGCGLGENPYTTVQIYATCSGPTEIIINNQRQLPALDPATFGIAGANPYTALRNLTFANLYLTVAAGGFQGRMVDPGSIGTGYELAHP